MRTAATLTTCLLLAACGQDPAPTPATPVSEAFEPDGAKPPIGPVDATYLCDGGNRVDLIENRRFARIAMSDGRVVQLGAMDKSQPPPGRMSACASSSAPTTSNCRRTTGARCAARNRPPPIRSARTAPPAER